ncbi:MAG: TolC family protein, partial [Planctomycetota bacterium]
MLLTTVAGCHSLRRVIRHVRDTDGRPAGLGSLTGEPATWNLADDDHSLRRANNNGGTLDQVMPCSAVELDLDSLGHYLKTAALSPADGTSVIRDRLTLEDVEAMAMRSHPSILQLRSTVDAAYGRQVQSGLPFNPVLQYRSDEVGNEGSSGLHSLSIAQQFVTADKLGLAQQVESGNVQKQLARLTIEEKRVLARVRTAFSQCVIAQQRKMLTEQISRVAEESVEAVHDLFKAGEASRLALLQMRVQADQAGIDNRNATTTYDATRRALVAAVGDSSVKTAVLEGDLSESLRDRRWDTMIGEVLESSPEMSLAVAELQRAQWSLQLSCAQVVPNITGQVGIGYDAGTDDPFAQIGVSVPLPVRNRNQGNIRSSKAEVVAAENAIERTGLSLEMRLAASVGRYNVARETHDRLTSAVLPAAEEGYELAAQAYRVGEVDYLQLLTAQRVLFDARLDLLDALEGAATAAAEIDTALVDLP